MARSKWLAGMGVVVLGAALVGAQQQRAATRPARQSRLVQPWSQIKDLNDDVKSKIVDIHRKANEERAAITAKERQDIMALLTEDQKKQVNDYEVQRTRGARTATTRPAGR